MLGGPPSLRRTSQRPNIPTSQHPNILTSQPHHDLHHPLRRLRPPGRGTSQHPNILTSQPIMTAIVLFGGSADERHVSVASAQNVAAALAEGPPPPLCWFWTPEGAVHDVAPAELLAHRR